MSEPTPNEARLLAWLGDAQLPGAPGVRIADEVAAALAEARDEALEVDALAEAISRANAGISLPYRAGAATIAREYSAVLAERRKDGS